MKLTKKDIKELIIILETHTNFDLIDNNMKKQYDIQEKLLEKLEKILKVMQNENC